MHGKQRTGLLDRAQCANGSGSGGLGLLGLEGEVFGLSALLARNRVEDLFLGLG